MKTLIDVPDFPGFEPTGELRIPNRGEYFYFNTGKCTLEMSHGNGFYPYLIYRKIKTPAEHAAEYTLEITPNDIYLPSVIDKIDWTREYEFCAIKEGVKFISGNGMICEASDAHRSRLFRLTVKEPK